MHRYIVDFTCRHADSGVSMSNRATLGANRLLTSLEDAQANLPGVIEKASEVPVTHVKIVSYRLA